MFFTKKLIVACLVIMSVDGLENSPPSHKSLLVRQPVIPSRFRTYDTPVDVLHAAGQQRSEDVSAEHKVRVAMAYLKEKHNIQAESVRVTDAYTNKDTGVSHVYVRQIAGGVDVVNGLANINIDKHGRVISSSQSFAPADQVRKAVRSGRLASRTNQYTLLKYALQSLSEHIESKIGNKALQTLRISKVESAETHGSKFVVDGIPTNTAVDGKATAHPAMMQRSDGSLIHVWDIVLKQRDHWWNARVNTATGEVQSLDDWVLRLRNNTSRQGVVNAGANNGMPAKSSSIGSRLRKRLSYLVIPITRQDPRDGFDLVVNPETGSSPNGWVDTNTTSGNNVVAYKGGDTSSVALETSPGTFVYNLDETESPATPQNVGASVVQVFYIINSLHDILYLYGFTEATFNFQDDNFGKGGQGNDRVLASVQDGAAVDNLGDFSVPPDGLSGKLRTFLWDLTDPDRDGGLQADFIAHLYGLGVSARLVGGGTATCLQSRISSGLQSGYGDAIAEWLEQTDTVPDFTMGTYVENNTQGIRSYPYSRDSAVNPLTYADADPSVKTSRIGEVWANMLHNVLAALADNRGWSNTAITDPTGTLGNVVYMHLLIDGLSIAPCEPTFIEARDAIIQADQIRYGGDHYCIIWRVFASRGLGFGAAEDNVDEYSVPPGC